MGHAKLVTKWAGWAPQIGSLLRIVAAFMFILAGATKLFAFPIAAMPGGGTVRFASQLGIGAVLEVFGGALLLVGLFTRPVAFLLAGEMAVAYFQFHWKFQMDSHVFPAVNQGELAALYSFVFLFIACRGGVKWCLDKTK